jgi:hypothetical protein
MGMVVLRSTTPCVVESSFKSTDLITLNSIAWLSSRAVPVADIYTFLNEAYSAAAYFIPFWRPAKGLRTPAKAFTCGNPRKSLLVLFALFQLASHFVPKFTDTTTTANY